MLALLPVFTHIHMLNNTTIGGGDGTVFYIYMKLDQQTRRVSVS